MSIETMLAKLTEGTTFKLERVDGTRVELPGQEVAAALGSVSRQIRLRSRRKNAGLSTEYGLVLMTARCTDHSLPKRLAQPETARLAWRLFWEMPGNKNARVSKDQFENLARVAIDDYCNPGHYHRAKDYTMSQAIGMHVDTWESRFKLLYGDLKSRMSRAEFPVQADFWRALG